MANLFELQMIKRLEERMEEYRKEINKKQDLALLIESIYLLKNYSVKSSGCTEFWGLEPKKGCMIDVVNQTYIRLIDQMLDELRKVDFIIYLDEYSEIKGLYKSMQQFDEVDPVRNREISKMYDNMSISFDYLKKIMESFQINFIELLIDHGQYDVIVELLLSSKVTDEQKFGILDTIIVKYPDKLKDIFKTIPESYYNHSENKESNQQVVEQLLNKNLQHIFSDRKEYIEEVIKMIINSYSDSMGLIIASNIVKFFIEHNLIDINTIVWNYEGKKITTAAAAYVMGKEGLAKYLYSLPEYLDNDKLIKDTSDMVIAGRIITSYYPDEIEKFISQPNYTSDKEKFFCIMEMIDERIKHDNEKQSSCTINAEAVTNILLRKTKKEDYKKIKQEYEKREKELADSIKEEEMLKAKRQEFVSMIGLMSEFLLEQVPAKKKIKDLKFVKK